MPQDPVIQKARLQPGDQFRVSTAPQDRTADFIAEMDYEGEDAEAVEAMHAAENAVQSAGPSLVPADEIDKELHSFEVDPGQVHPFDQQQQQQSLP